MNVVIIGGGQVGAYIANLLLESKHHVMVIENREAVLEKIREELPMGNIVAGNGTDPNVLEAAGIQRADVVAAVTGADEVNLVATTIAKFEFGVKRVLARVNNPKNAWLFDASMGVDVVLNQANLMARIIIEEMNLDQMMMLLKLGGSDYSISQFKVCTGANAIGQRMGDLRIPASSSFVAIDRGGQIVMPSDDVVIEEGDNLVIFADEPAMEVVHSLCTGIKACS